MALSLEADVVDRRVLADESGSDERGSDQARIRACLTNKMRARLQGFPDEWEFVGGLGAVADQVGNAVAPKGAQAVGLAIYSALKGWEIDVKNMMWPKGRRLSIEPPLIDAVPAAHVEQDAELLS